MFSSSAGWRCVCQAEFIVHPLRPSLSTFHFPLFRLSTLSNMSDAHFGVPPRLHLSSGCLVPSCLLLMMHCSVIISRRRPRHATNDKWPGEQSERARESSGSSGSTGRGPALSIWSVIKCCLGSATLLIRNVAQEFFLLKQALK